LDVDANYDKVISVDNPDDPIEMSAGGIVCVGGREKIIMRKVQPPSWVGDVLLTKNSTKVRVFDAVSNGTEIVFDGIHNKFANTVLEKALYVQGETYSSTPRDVTLTLTSNPGSLVDEITFTVLKVEFHKADTEDVSGNRYGYDTMDTQPGDDHVSVKKNDSTYVKVKIFGADDGSMLHFTSSDSTTAEPGSAPSPAPATGFLLEVKGKDKDKSETKIQARLGSATGPVCAEICANVYKEKVINEWHIYRVTDSSSAGTSPLSALSGAGTQSSANAIVKQGVMNFSVVDVTDTNINYDVNTNGALEWFYDGGAQTEFSIIQGAGLIGNPKIAVVKNVNFAWRMSTNAVAGQSKIKVVGASYLSSWVGRTYTLGTGASSESLTLSSVSGTELTFSTNLANAHTAGELLIATFGAGVGADPQIVEDGAAIQTTLLHETLHRADVGNLLDVNSTLNIMHYSTGVGHTELRFKELLKYYGGGNESQWETIQRP
jgi:hypothetical protein